MEEDKEGRKEGEGRAGGRGREEKREVSILDRWSGKTSWKREVLVKDLKRQGSVGRAFQEAKHSPNF
jgi:hypothetical protein